MNSSWILISILFTAALASSAQKSNSGDRWRVLNPDVLKDRRLGFSAAGSSPFPLWQRPLVPYTLDPNLDENLRRVVLGAMGEISSKSCLTFKPKWSQDVGNLDIIKVNDNKNSCHAQLKTPENIALHIGMECLKAPGGILRLILNALGMPLKNNVNNFSKSPSFPLCHRQA